MWGEKMAYWILPADFSRFYNLLSFEVRQRNLLHCFRIKSTSSRWVERLWSHQSELRDSKRLYRAGIHAPVPVGLRTASHQGQQTRSMKSVRKSLVRKYHINPYLQWVSDVVISVEIPKNINCIKIIKIIFSKLLELSTSYSKEKYNYYS